MSGKLCLLNCQGFCPEIGAAIAAEGWPDVIVVPVAARHGQPPPSWSTLRPLIPADCTGLLTIGRACLEGLGEPPAGWPPVRQLPIEECFRLVAGATLVDEAIARGGYLITPAWLDDWRGNLSELGYEEESAADFFRDFARELVLLDTGIVPDAPAKLAELAKVAGLTATRVAVGIDYTRALLARWVAEWRTGDERRRASERDRGHARELADYVSAMDFLGRLTALKNEQETIAAIQEMFSMLFAPEELHYVRFEGGVAQWDEAPVPANLLPQIGALNCAWAWTASGSGFLLRISRTGEPLAVIAVERLAYPAFRDRYLNLALSIAGVCGLAIENARTYGRIKKTEAALRKSEYSLKMAQAMAHLGHWEWDMHTGEMQWSDETYRILGYEPQRLAPSRTTFFDVIHPDDRALVTEQIGRLREGGGCDFEYRIVLHSGRVRVVHCVVEMIIVGETKKPTVIGTIADVTAPWRQEMLGVVQDITERKELEQQLAQEARTDPLTGCANRRHFLELAEQHLAHVHRYGGEMSVLMLDLDHFKRVNDEHGHQAGDLALQKVVQVCRVTLREVDVIARLGGEEFCILLPETGRARAREVAERVRRAVADAELPLENKPPLRFTVSIGASTLLAGETRDALIGRADQALYEAKNTGRNKVVAAEGSAVSPE